MPRQVEAGSSALAAVPCLPGQRIGGCQLAAQQLHRMGEHLRCWRQQAGALAQLEEGGKRQGRTCRGRVGRQGQAGTRCCN